MIAFVFLGLLACAAAAPHYRHHHSPLFDSCCNEGGDIFDTGRFWEDLRREMASLDTMLADLNKRFPSAVTSTGERVGNEYIVTIPLSGFQEKDIVIKAKKGLLMVQAVRSSGPVRMSFLDVTTLPDDVNEAGNWSYDNGVLKITFTINGAPTTVKVDEGTGEPVTTEPERSREEVIEDNSVGRGDLFRSNDIQRNEIEATTYAVDLNDEVEFVPMRY